MPSYNELLAQIESLKAQAEQQRATEIANVVEEIKTKMAEYGITLADLGGGRRKKAAASGRSSVAPKYRNDATGDTWSGRGKAPRWLVEAEAKGQSRESFLIKN